MKRCGAALTVSCGLGFGCSALAKPLDILLLVADSILATAFGFVVPGASKRIGSRYSSL